MRDDETNSAMAVRVARMYYHQELTTQQIADELELSRTKVSRLLTHARERGFVEIRVIDPNAELQRLEREIRSRFGIAIVQVVSVPETVSEQESLGRVALAAAAYLNALMENDTILALAWGTTTSALSARLIPKALAGVQVVQLNGSGNTHDMGLSYSSEILRNFANAYRAQTHPFPVPTFFDYPATKRALWRERSIGRILEMQQRADILLYSIGAVQAGVPSHVYTGGYLEREDLAELEQQRVAGDVATVFFRADGTYRDIPINARTSGPDLELFQKAEHALCVVSGKGKAAGLHAALVGGYLNTLIVDEPTAREVLKGSSHS
jgi:deoxyribonucleoside regulator